MHNEHTIDAVRLALGMYQMRAYVASLNIANANAPGARALQADFSTAQAALESAAAGSSEPGLTQALKRLQDDTPVRTQDPIQLDQQVGEMAAATMGYQSLGEALSRQFGLMRLATTGRS